MSVKENPDRKKNDFWENRSQLINLKLLKLEEKFGDDPLEATK